MNKFFFILISYLIQFTIQDNIIQNNTNYTIPLYLRRRSKYCHFKCNCFFSHTVINDNISVKNWIKY